MAPLIRCLCAVSAAGLTYVAVAGSLIVSRTIEAHNSLRTCQAEAAASGLGDAHCVLR